MSHIIDYKYVIIRTVKEQPEGEALGIFDTMEFAIDFIMNKLDELEYYDEDYESAVIDLETKGYIKVDHEYYFKISKTPVYFVENRRPFNIIDESSSG